MPPPPATPTPQGTTQPPLPLDLILGNPEVVESVANTVQLLLLASLIITRRSLAKIKDRLAESVQSLTHSPKPRTYLDPDQLIKSHIYELAHRTLFDTKASWVAIGIFSNGRMSSFGYHFSQLTYEYWVGRGVPLEQLRQLPPTSLSSPLVTSLLAGVLQPIVEPISGYCVYFYPVTVGNMVIATVAVGYQDSPPSPPAWPATLGQLSEVFKRHIRT